MKPQEPTPKRRKDKFLLLLLVLMTIGCAMFAWLYVLEKKESELMLAENIQIAAESEIVKRDLQQLRAEYDALQTDHEALRKEIEEKKMLIEQLQREAEKHKNDAYTIAKLKKETKTLREIMKHFVKEIDSLNTLNKQLRAAKDSAMAELQTEKTKSTALQAEKEKLYKIGSTLKANNITVKAIHIRGKDRQSETSKAKRTDKILISFVLAENKIAPRGQRTIYIRMVTPDGKEWTESADADHIFSFNGSKGFYAAKKTVQYENAEMEVVMSIKKKDNEEFLSGKYLIEVNIDNTTIGSATLVLE